MADHSRRPNLVHFASSSSSIPEGAMTPRSEHEHDSLLPDLERLPGSGTTSTSGSRTPSHYGTTGNKAVEKRQKLKKRVQYYIPSFAWIPNYTLSSLAGDILAGATVASMLIPQSVSYASSLAKLNPVTGLYAASIPAIFYALLGTSRHLNVAPEAALSLLLGQAVDDVRHDMDDPHSPEADAIALSVSTVITLQVGLISFLLGFFRLGFIDVVLSRALLRGFISAVAVVILIEQLIPMFGLVPLERVVHPATTLEKLLFLIENMFTHRNPFTTLISFASLATLIFMRLFKNMFKRYWFIYRIPEVLVVVILSTEYFEWDKHGVDILGSVNVKTHGSFIQSPFRGATMKYLRRTSSTAVVSAVAGYLDSMVAGKQAASRFGYTISPNRELVALGASNLAGSFVPGTLSAFGSITRTRINGDVGGTTQMASLICSGIILLATFFLLPWLYYLPKCVLASIITLIVFSLLAETPHDLHYYWKMSAWMDLTLVFLTFVFSIVYNVEVGIVISLIISLLLVVHKSSRARMTILGRIPGTDRWKPINEVPEVEEDVSGALIVRIKENLDFANTAQLKERLRRLELYGIDKSHPSEDPRRHEATVLVFHLADVDSCDAISSQIFYELLEEYGSRGVGLYITHLRPKVRETFEKAGIMKLLGPYAIQENVADAMRDVNVRFR
ncbi:hypothetical protein D9758_005947 [Tetrapyrgos nigripes]|uniref:STAS domain-containing protein n=1 Tax=Tetrapyrgos nigripes TaxID=182062 RepID=A0A8H5G2X9_9AGAR|nr:hypothetical protein D9758_005947 [Tetrapyrgos nigripes]